MKTRLYSVEEILDAEAAALSQGVTIEELMEKAGKAVAEVITANFSPCRVVIFSGPGKNGGDAMVVGRILKERKWSVDLIEWDDPIANDDIQELLNNAGLIVDGLLGSGLSRPLDGKMLRYVEMINTAKAPVVSIDIPSGVDGNTGSCFGISVKATCTVTFSVPRIGHYLLPGRICRGKLFVKEIDIPLELFPKPKRYLNDPNLWLSRLKLPSPCDHKYSRGACIVYGNGCMPGALRLATRAARRIGAGLVRMTCNPEDYPILAGAVWGEIVEPLLKVSDFFKWTEDDRYKSYLLGSGAVPTPVIREQTLLLLSTKKPCVLDGGALSAFEGKAQELIPYLHDHVVVTPHDGEFLKLFPHLAFLNNKAEKTSKAAVESGAIVVLKGHDTVIASPKGEAIINANAPATLATAGTGDVLAGVVTGLLAQGVAPYDAAASGVWIHGYAASLKGLGLIAEDLLGEIPAVLDFLRTLQGPDDAINCP